MAWNACCDSAPRTTASVPRLRWWKYRANNVMASRARSRTSSIIWLNTTNPATRAKWAIQCNVLVDVFILFIRVPGARTSCRLNSVHPGLGDPVAFLRPLPERRSAGARFRVILDPAPTCQLWDGMLLRAKELAIHAANRWTGGCSDSAGRPLACFGYSWRRSMTRSGGDRSVPRALAPASLKTLLVGDVRQ